MVFTSIYHMVTKWVPKDEKSQLFNLIWSGKLDHFDATMLFSFWSWFKIVSRRTLFLVLH